MGYNIEAIKAKLAKVTTKTEGAGSAKKSELKYFKAGIGEYDIRFLPYEDPNGQPFQVVSYYNKLSKKGERRIISPATFELPDPIKEVFDVVRKGKGKEVWNIAKNLQPQDKVYALIIDRAHEEDGPLVWEFTTEIRDKIYGILTKKFYLEEQMFDKETGYDFALSITQKKDAQGKPATFNGYPVKNVELTPSPKSTKLHKDAKKANEWIANMPKLYDYFKSQLMTGEELAEKCDAYIASCTSAPQTPEGTDVSSEKGVTPEMEDEAVSDKVDEAFKDV
jgi:hypothetical protein